MTEELAPQEEVPEVVTAPTDNSEAEVAETPVAEAVTTPVEEEKPAEAEAAPAAKDKKKKKSKPANAKFYIPVKVGDQLEGTVKTVTKFGAFISLDLTVDGLVHISALSRQRVENVTDVVNVGDKVTVWVKNIDRERGRVGLTMIKPVTLKFSEVESGDELAGTVTRIENYGVFVDVSMSREGLVHVSELSHEYVKVPADVVTVGEPVNVKVLDVDRKKKRINLSIKALLEAPEVEESEEAQAKAKKASGDEGTMADLKSLDQTPLTTTMAAAFDVGAPESAKGKKGKSAKKARKKDMSALIEQTLQLNAD